MPLLNQPDAAAEKELRESDERNHNMKARSEEDAIVLLSPDGVVLSGNTGVLCVTGYADREIIGLSFDCFYLPEARDDGRPGLLLGIARAEGRVETVEWCLRKDGTRFWADVLITALRDGRGGMIGFATVTRDLTARPREADAFLLRAGEELASSLDYETTLQRVVHQALPVLADVSILDVVVDDSQIRPLAVAHIDPTKEDRLLELARRLDQSPAFAARVIRTGHSLIMPVFSETAVRSIAEEDQLPVNPETIWALHQLDMTSGIMVPLVAREKTLGALSLVRLDGSEPFGPQDLPLTEHLAHECALAVDNARLYREAQESVRARDELLASTSHELRRPLSEIKGFATTLLRTDVQWDQPERQDFLQEIDREANLLDTLINDLLDMSLLASVGSQHIDRAPTCAAVVVSGAVDRMRGHLSERVLEIDANLDTLPQVSVNAQRIEQVLANLIENASKYAPGSAISISGAVVNQGREVELCVEDDGPGIAADDLAHVFDRFYRGRSALRTEVPGTGLGLAIAQAIVEGHGGHIRAENRPGGGARFVFSVPVASRRSHRSNRT